jgi:hypothetical protein
MTSISTEFCIQPFTKMQYHFYSLMAFTLTKDMELRKYVAYSLLTYQSFPSKDVGIKTQVVL